jgi:aminoglycoside/choline kinase family phosphotransferase
MSVTAHPAAGPVPDQIRAYLARRGSARPAARVVPLTGDASDRRYFRLIEADGSTSVLAVYGAPFKYDALPFVNVAGLLQQLPLPVPAILDHAEDLGLLRLQDLGDVTMQAHLGAATPGEHAALYRQAVGFIEVLQRRGRQLESPAYAPYSLAFDTQKLTCRRPRATRSRKNGRPSSTNWQPSRVCSAIAITTAET